MKQYLTLLQDILDKGTWKAPARENLPPTLSLFGTRMEFDMKDGFPLLTTKEVHFKSIVIELLWFLKGDTNIKYLVDNGCNIWNQDAYRWYLKKCEEQKIFFPYDIEMFINTIKNSNIDNTCLVDYRLGDLGKVYGYQWRDQNGVDQIQVVLDRLQSEPEGRYAILDAWNPADFSEMALPPCHLLYQFNCREIDDERRRQLFRNCLDDNNAYLAGLSELDWSKIEAEFSIPKYHLDLQLYQRSCDTLLGVPFNIASGSLLLHIIAKIVGMEPGKFIWIGGDTHIYENHMEQVKEQLRRTPTTLPQLKLSDQVNWDYITKHPVHNQNELLKYLTHSDFKIENYNPQAKIKGELNVGLKK